MLESLPNHVPLWANPANDLGAATVDLKLTMVLSRGAEQQAALDKLLADQKNPASPDYHHWLTPAEIGERFGVSDADVQAVCGWMEGQGLRVTWVAPSRMFIGFGGSAAAVGHAFGTVVHNYRVNGADRISVISAPLIPMALLPVVKSVLGLYSIDDKAAHAARLGQMAKPDLTISSGSNFIAPADFNTIYDGFVGTSGYQQTIGIVGRSRTNSADFVNFQRLTVSNFQQPTEIVPTAFGGVDPGPALTAPPTGATSIAEQMEATLDVTRAGSVAPNANLLLVVASGASGGIEDDAQYLVQTLPVPAQVMTISYGACESQAGPSGVTFWNTLFEQAAAEGITAFVSSGDSGASGCEAAFVAPVANPSAISPNYICASSYATCVGGTQFDDTASPGTYWGVNGSNLASALMYIPEGGWNEPTDSKGTTQLAASGGGASGMIATPSWQKGTGVPAARAGRYTPDLSFSSSCHDGYFGCVAAAGGSCVVSSTGSFTFMNFCGTSAAAPSMAGVAALLDEKMKFPQGNINPEIYAMAQNQPSSFHDATPATSGVANCDLNTPSTCNNSTPGITGLTGGQTGYAVTVGFDPVTGWGSPDILNFLNNFAMALPVPTVTATPSAATITDPQAVTVTINVVGGTGLPTPTGTVTLSSLPYISGPRALSNGKATILIPGGSLPASVDTTILTSEYLPDAQSSGTYSPAVGTCSVAVTPIIPTLVTTFSPAGVTTAQDLTLKIAVNGGTGNPLPTGTVTIDNVTNTGAGYTTTGPVVAGIATFDIPAGWMPPGTDRIDSSYTPDAAGAKAYSTAIASSSVTILPVPKTTPRVTASLANATITITQPTSVTVTVTPATGSPTPTGTASVTGNGSTLTMGLSGGSATIPIPPAWLPAGTQTLTIGYPGDYNTNAATTTAALTVTKATPIMTVTPGASAITNAQDLQVAVYLTGALGVPSPSGNITVSSGSYSSAPTTLNGSTVVTIPAGSLPAGADALTVAYSGDNLYSATTNSTTIVTVTAIPASFTLAGTTVTISAPGVTTGDTSTITITPAGGFTGSVALTAALTSSPTGAQYLPTFSFGSTTPVAVNGASAATATLTVSTTAPTTGALVPASRPGSLWYPLGETALAGVLIFGFRTRLRGLRMLIGMMLLLTAVTACGGGSSTPGPAPTPGTSAGTYVVTITGNSGSTSASTSLNVVIQ